MQSTKANDPDAYEMAFEEKMTDPMWTAEIAAGWRAEMLSPDIIQ
jgi:hypothetical protein